MVNYAWDTYMGTDLVKKRISFHTKKLFRVYPAPNLGLL